MARSLLKFAGITLLSLTLGACAGSGCAGPTAADAGAAESLAPVPAPAGLIAELSVTTPQATWSKVRVMAGGPAMFLPQSFGAVAATMLGLPITIASEIDDALPVVGAVVKNGDEPVHFALGLHVKVGERLVDQLTKGEAARFITKKDEASRIMLLFDKDPTSPAARPFAIGVLGNYLLVAQKVDDLTALGPYVARTLGARPAPKEEIAIELPESGLSGPLLTKAREIRAQGERSTASMLPLGSAVDTVIDVLSDAKSARITFALDQAALHGRFAATPRPGGGPATKALAALVVGDAKPLLELPDATSLAIVWRESPAARSEAIPKQAAAISKMLGKEAPEADKEAFLAALRAEADARGAVTAFGLGFAGTGPTAVVRAPATDEEKMRTAMKQLVDLAAQDSVKAALRDLGISIATDKAVIENLPGDAQRVRFERIEKDGKDTKGDKPDKAKDAKDTKGDKAAKPADAKPKDGKPAKEDKAAKDAATSKDDKGKKKPDDVAAGETPKAIDLVYLVGKDGLFAAAGYDPKDALRALVKAPSGPNLGSNARMTGVLADLGADASFVLLADGLKLLSALRGGNAPADATPLLIALGRRGAEGAPELWGRVDLPTPVIQRLVQEIFFGRRAAQ